MKSEAFHIKDNKTLNMYRSYSVDIEKRINELQEEIKKLRQRICIKEFKAWWDEKEDKIGWLKEDVGKWNSPDIKPSKDCYVIVKLDNGMISRAIYIGRVWHYDYAGTTSIVGWIPMPEGVRHMPEGEYE